MLIGHRDLGTVLAHHRPHVRGALHERPAVRPRNPADRLHRHRRPHLIDAHMPVGDRVVHPRPRCDTAPTGHQQPRQPVVVRRWPLILPRMVPPPFAVRFPVARIIRAVERPPGVVGALPQQLQRPLLRRRRPVLVGVNGDHAQPAPSSTGPCAGPGPAHTRHPRPATAP